MRRWRASNGRGKPDMSGGYLSLWKLMWMWTHLGCRRFKILIVKLVSSKIYISSSSSKDSSLDALKLTSILIFLSTLRVYLQRWTQRSLSHINCREFLRSPRVRKVGWSRILAGTGLGKLVLEDPVEKEVSFFFRFWLRLLVSDLPRNASHSKQNSRKWIRLLIASLSYCERR